MGRLPVRFCRLVPIFRALAEHSKQNCLQNGRNVRNLNEGYETKKFVSVIRKESRNAIVNNSSNPGFSIGFPRLVGGQILLQGNCRYEVGVYFKWHTTCEKMEVSEVQSLYHWVEDRCLTTQGTKHGRVVAEHAEKKTEKYDFNSRCSIGGPYGNCIQISLQGDFSVIS